MSNPDPRFDPENVRVEDSKFAPKAKALKSKLNKAQKTSKKILSNAGREISKNERKEGESPLEHLKRLTK